MKQIIEVKRETYGHDHRAINKHSERWFRDNYGRLFVLSRTLDGCPPFFEAYGPFAESYEGILPRLRVAGKEYWGNGWTWKQAINAFCAEIGASIRRKR